MGRPPSNGGPSFRFNQTEVAEMESVLQAHKFQVPERDLCQSLADKFSRSAEREGKVVIQMKQVWNWFQNRRYAIRAKGSKVPGKLNVAPSQQNDLAAVRSVPQAPRHFPVPPGSSVNNVAQVPQSIPAQSGQSAVKNTADNSQMEFEAKSSRDGAWYDVASFLSHRSLENAGLAVLVRFAGFGQEEDEWVNVQKNVRQRSLPCEASECVAVLPNDLILCFQEGKEQALYYDAHVLDAQRRRHDIRGCRCRFLVRYDHDQSEEIVPLRKVCRRPETDYRLLQLHADSANLDQNKSGSVPPPGNPMYPVAIANSTGKKAEIRAETTQKQPTTVKHTNTGTVTAPVPHANLPVNISAAPMNHLSAPVAPASADVVDSSLSTATNAVLVADPTPKQPTTGVHANSGTVVSPVPLANAPANISGAPMSHSNAPLAPASAGAVDSSVSMVTNVVPVADTTPKQPTTAEHANTGTVMAPVFGANVTANISASPTNHSNTPLGLASAGAVDSSVSVVSSMVPVADSSCSGTFTVPPATFNDHVVAQVIASTVPVADSSLSGSSTMAPTLDAPLVTPPIASAEKAPGPATTNNEVTTDAVAAHVGVASGVDMCKVPGDSGERMHIG